MTGRTVRFLAPNAVRITQPPADEPVWVRDVLVQKEIPAAQGRLGVEGQAPMTHLTDAAGRSIVQVRADGLTLTLGIEPGEGFYGFGEWFNAFRRTQGTLRLKNRDAPSVIQGRYTYSGIPFFLSSRGYGFLLLNAHATTWKIDPRRGTLTVTAEGPPLDYVVIHGPSFREIIGTYTLLTGRPPLLPRWAFGLWVTSYPQEHQDALLELVRAHRARAIPLDAAILDYHWEERFHNFQWRSSLIPDPDKLIGALTSQGVRLGLIITPFINRHNGYLGKMILQTLVKDIPPGMVFGDDRALPLYRKGRAQGYFAHANARWWFGQGGMLDYTNPAACAWWGGLMRPLYDQGVAFFKNDDGEYLPEEARSFSGLSGREHHNLYGFYYGRAIYEDMGALDARRPLIYARSVWAGSQRYPAMFLGDQRPTFECLKRTLRAGLNLSLAGFAYWTADCFGLDGRTTPETHMRHAQFALFVPVARYFVRPPRIDDTRSPWSHSAACEESFRKHVALRYRLLPYYLALAWESWLTGLPIMRPMVLEFQDDARFAETYDQVMLGEQIMLAPVVEAGATSRRIILPAGTWHDFWSARTWQGPTEIVYDAPLDTLPILVRGGAVIPMGPDMPSIPDDHRLDTLTLHFWPPYPSSATSLTLYEDDGRTTAYQSGAFATTSITVAGRDDRLVITIGAASGRFPWQPEARTIACVLSRTDPPREVTVNGDPVTIDYDRTRREARLGFLAPVQASLRVEVQY